VVGDLWMLCAREEPVIPPPMIRQSTTTLEGVEDREVVEEDREVVVVVVLWRCWNIRLVAGGPNALLLLASSNMVTRLSEWHVIVDEGMVKRTLLSDGLVPILIMCRNK